jgi:hypothetical protein
MKRAMEMKVSVIPVDGYRECKKRCRGIPLHAGSSAATLDAGIRTRKIWGLIPNPLNQ